LNGSQASTLEYLQAFKELNIELAANLCDGANLIYLKAAAFAVDQHHGGKREDDPAGS